MRAYTTEQASDLAHTTRTLGLGQVDPGFLALNSVEQGVYNQLSGGMTPEQINAEIAAGSISNPPPIMGSTGSPSGLLIGLGILALVMLSGGGHGH